MTQAIVALQLSFRSYMSSDKSAHSLAMNALSYQYGKLTNAIATEKVSRLCEYKLDCVKEVHYRGFLIVFKGNDV